MRHIAYLCSHTLKDRSLIVARSQNYNSEHPDCCNAVDPQSWKHCKYLMSYRKHALASNNDHSLGVQRTQHHILLEIGNGSRFHRGLRTRIVDIFPHSCRSTRPIGSYHRERLLLCFVEGYKRWFAEATRSRRRCKRLGLLSDILEVEVRRLWIRLNSIHLKIWLIPGLKTSFTFAVTAIIASLLKLERWTNPLKCLSIILSQSWGDRFHTDSFYPSMTSTI